MACLSLSLLGGFRARLDLGPPLLLPAKAQALLAYLAVRPGQAHPRDKLAALLWGGTSEAQARRNLRHTLFDIRRAVRGVSPGALVAEAQTIALAPAALDVDALTFERLVAEGTAEALERATTLYQGELLEGLSVNEPPFEEWLLAERERIRELAVEALARLLAHQSQSQATEHAIRTAIRLLALDPLQEAAHRALMRLYARQGRRGAALRQYQVCVDLMQRELGVEPEPETKQLYQEILKRQLRQPEWAASPAPGAKWQVASALRAEPPRRETPLIGREAEIGRLREALGEVVRGHGRSLLVCGETGIGKSRLLAEIIAEAATGDGCVLTGRCYESERILPFGPWVAAIRAAPDALSPTLLDRLAPVWRAELSRLLPELGPRELGAPGSGDNHLRLFDAMAELFALLASSGLLVLVIEDLHWADEMSVRLLSFLVRRLVAHPILFLVTARTEELPESPVLRQVVEELEAETRITGLTLMPLSRQDTEALVEVWAGRGTDGAEVTRLAGQVWRISEGNPFVIVETMRALRDESLKSDTGLWLARRVRDVVSARLARLSDVSRRLVAVAAVIGRDFEFAVLHRASEFGEREAAAAIEELVRLHVFHAVGERLDFVHQRIREVAVSQIVSPQRRSLHRVIGSAVEELYTDNLAPHYAELGLHFREAEVWDKAAKYLHFAGVQAYANLAPSQAVACYEQALTALSRLPETRETLELAVDVRLDLRRIHTYTSDHQRAVYYLREAEPLARALLDHRRLGLVLAFLCGGLNILGDYAGALEAGERALALAETLADLTLEVESLLHLGQACRRKGDYSQAREVLARAVRLLENDAPVRSGGAPRFGASRKIGRFPYWTVLTQGRFHLVLSLIEVGEFSEALSRADQNLEEVDAAGDEARSLHHVLALLTLGCLHVRRGAISLAIPLLERALPAAQTGVPNYFPWVLSRLGYAYAMAGHPEKGLPRLMQGAELLSGSDRNAHELCMLGEAYLLAGDPEGARATAERALTRSRRRTEHGNEAWALWLLGEVASHRDPADPTEAKAHYAAALTTAEKPGMKLLTAHCHLGLGKLYRRTDKREQAREHLATSTAMYRDMDMTYWLEKAEAETAKLG